MLQPWSTLEFVFNRQYAPRRVVSQIAAIGITCMPSPKLAVAETYAVSWIALTGCKPDFESFCEISHRSLPLAPIAATNPHSSPKCGRCCRNSFHPPLIGMSLKGD